MSRWFQSSPRTSFLTLGLALMVAACGQLKESSSGDDGGSCSLTDNTSNTSTVNANGCYRLSRDTTSCYATRVAQGLTGFWLNFSCRVSLTKSGGNVIVTVDNQPDYTSYYFGSSHSCFESTFPSGRSANPNQLASKSISLTVPMNPSAAGSKAAMGMGLVGIASNGVVIYSNSAAGADDIYEEVSTFDRCDGHPDGNKNYHYHTEPPAISNEDSNFIGVMRDGFPIYGRYESGTTAPVGLDGQTKGHETTTADSGGSPIFHYHVNLQTSSNPGTTGQTAWFIVGGYYHGTKSVTCTNCP